MDDEEYLSVVVLHIIFYYMLFFGLLTFLYISQGDGSIFLRSALYSGLITGVLAFSLFRYPRVIAGKKAEKLDEYLVFALKDLKLQISAGLSLYSGIVNTAQAGYGVVSQEFKRAAQLIATGVSEREALERMAASSKSDFLRRTVWQLTNTLRAGASVRGALSVLIKDLMAHRKESIRGYTHELNLWVLMYLLFSVVIPSIGASLMVVLSTFAGFGVTPASFISFLVISLLIQVALIGFVKTRRPMVGI